MNIREDLTRLIKDFELNPNRTWRGFTHKVEVLCFYAKSEGWKEGIEAAVQKIHDMPGVANKAYFSMGIRELLKPQSKERKS